MIAPALLLDTCVLLWLLEGDSRIVDNKNLISFLNQRRRFFSSISIAEMEIKKSIGKLKIPDEYQDRIMESGIKELGFSREDAGHLGSLPFYHKDPFDRMLIATAINNSMIIVTGDKSFCNYPVQVYVI
ncbi:MAG: type II toxin-antitoxin system VapC family toxin [Candidatus Heimdallarchaeota archaeon]|nr:type II toxin-antitoxin system VapC family toxin [Candidatus Heimdallarchaeota archaeon]